MPLKKLFLSHQHEDAPEVAELATELRLRGVVPWVDKLRGGFAVGDGSEAEARRAIREDCFGLLLHATEKAYRSGFIREVELDEAKRAKAADPSYLLFAFARESGFGDLGRETRARYGLDLAAYRGVAVGKRDVDDVILSGKWAEAARLVLERVVRRSTEPGAERVSVQVSTRDLFPDAPDDLLRVDATALLDGRVDDPAAWGRLLAGLRDVKDELARACGRPRLAVHGSKHLTAAFLIGRVFAPFELDIRQTPTEVWRTDAPVAPGTPLAATYAPGADGAGRLVVEVASRAKDVSAGVDAFVARHRLAPPARLRLVPANGPLDGNEQLCRAMAAQTYQAIEEAMRGRTFSSIHLFAAVPQAFMVMLGRAFKGMPPVHLHEWTGTRYVTACVVSGGVL